MTLYIPNIIQNIQTYYGNALLSFENNLKSYLDNLANLLIQGVNTNHDFLFTEINNYHPDYLGKTKSELKLLKWSLVECRQTIASEYGFKNWREISSQNFNRNFENAVQMVLSGEIESLKKLLRNEPQLAIERSVFGHKSTLLHYCGNNGVELWRQQIPSNLPDIIQVLLNAGAKKDSKMKVYRGEYTTKELFESSAHPHSTDIREECLRLL